MLETVDLSLTLGKDDYPRSLAQLQAALRTLGYQVYVQQRPVVVVFEGWEAAGKGDNIKRVTEKLDPRGYVVHPIGAPTGDDGNHHYLWRFWRRLPEKGQIAIFDRSWYRRVLAERVEGKCAAAEWKRAYREINHFEGQLTDFSTIVFKFWIHISPEEQLKRFEALAGDDLNRWRLSAADGWNREMWDRYGQAIEDMLLKTSTAHAPWTIVEGNCYRYAQVKVLRTLVEGLGRQLKYDPHKNQRLKGQGGRKSSKTK
jgi:AMP-polyphosphate phosphotransferase